MSNSLHAARSFFRKLFTGEGFARNVTFLAGGAALSQAVAVLAAPLLTRLYTPEEFGLLGIYVSIFSVLLVTSALSYEQAIPLPAERESGANLLVLSLLIVSMMSLLIAGACWFWGERIGELANAPGLRPYLWFLPLGILGAGSYKALNFWMAREKQFKEISYTKITRTSGQVGVQAGMGLLYAGPAGLFVGHTVGQLLGALRLLKSARLSEHRIAPGAWPALMRQYANFPLFLMWTSLVNNIGIYAPTVILSIFFSVESAGYFSHTMMVLGLPAGVIGQAVTQVFYPSAARMESEGSLSGKFLERVASSLFVISFSVFSIIAIHGTDLYSWVFGARWAIAGRYAQYLAPWFMIAFVSSPLASFALVKGRQRTILVYAIFLTGARFGAIWLGKYYASPDLSVIFFSATNVLFFIGYMNWILSLAGSGFLSWLGTIKGFVAGGIFLVICLFAIKVYLHPVASLVISVATIGILGLRFIVKLRSSE